MTKFDCITRLPLLFLIWAVSAASLPAQTFTTAYSFCSQTDCLDGYKPSAGLVQSASGKLYGTTAQGGGSKGSCLQGCGTVFEMTPGGVLTTLHTFHGPDGSEPYATLIQATDGKFYGTTLNGGANAHFGTVFSMTAEGTLGTLFSFNDTDGDDANELVQGPCDKLYGTTIEGGQANQAGTVFSITPTGMLTILYRFCTQSNCPDGQNPYAGLVLGTDGMFYGTTEMSGANGGGGTVFNITPEGVLTTIHSFCARTDCADGESPRGALVEGTDGKFYGTTQAGGSKGYGTVFSITPKGTLKTLYNFCSQKKCADGYYPNAGLVQGTDGNFYGTTSFGGELCPPHPYEGCGTVFQITSDGILTTLHTFNGADGATPAATLIQDTDGTFWGTTQDGGPNSACSYGCGTVFTLSMDLGPFVKTNPAAAKTGAKIGILGTDLTGASSVTFNGASAVFTVKSATFIVATVPSVATTGKIQVVTPNGTLSSNVPFIVLH